MEPEHRIPFGPFCLDMTQSRLWRGDQVIGLRPRSLAVLRYLVEHPGQLVTKRSCTARSGQGRMSPTACYAPVNGLGRKCTALARALAMQGNALISPVLGVPCQRRFPACQHRDSSLSA
jgi:hypothetical protein